MAALNLSSSTPQYDLIQGWADILGGGPLFASVQGEGPSFSSEARREGAKRPIFTWGVRGYAPPEILEKNEAGMRILGHLRLVFHLS